MRRHSTQYKYKVDTIDLMRTGKLSHNLAAEIIEWCIIMYGKSNWDYYLHTWRFRYKKDYVTFLLRWS